EQGEIRQPGRAAVGPVVEVMALGVPPAYGTSRSGARCSAGRRRRPAAAPGFPPQGSTTTRSGRPVSRLQPAALAPRPAARYSGGAQGRAYPTRRPREDEVSGSPMANMGLPYKETELTDWRTSSMKKINRRSALALGLAAASAAMVKPAAAQTAGGI